MTQSKAAAATTGASIKDTLESVLIAFILAFVFRAFVVEAFVIPSGSMAPTLLGANLRFRCQECGYPFEVNCPANPRGPDLAPPSRTGRQTVLSIHCPNCGYKIPARADDPDQAAQDTPVRYGDRILVLKYLYLLQEPKRWDVVVFKSPAQSAEFDYSQNYIKRLVGKPGESIMLLDGDVYVSHDWRPDEEASKATWEVQDKSRTAQDALWRVVYDNDFHPANKDRQALWQQPWRQIAGSGWDTGKDAHTGRVFTFSNDSGAGALSFDRDINQRANPGVYPLTDWLPYDETRNVALGMDNYAHEPYGDGLRRIPRWNVSDVMVRFYYQRRAGQGPLKVALTKLDHVFTAEIYPDKAKVIHQYRGREEVIGEVPLESAGAEPLKVEFQNVDYHVTLRINDRDHIWTTRGQYHPDVQDLLRRNERRWELAETGDNDAVRQVFPPPRIELSAERQSGQVSHLSLWRDVYYTPTMPDLNASNAYRRVYDLAWASPTRPIHLRQKSKEGAQDDEYFVLGDNSILSADARGWRTGFDDVELPEEDLKTDAGRVPGRFLLGKAFFVYWPAGYKPFGLDFLPAMAPNFGDMRFIH